MKYSLKSLLIDCLALIPLVIAFFVPRLFANSPYLSMAMLITLLLTALAIIFMVFITARLNKRDFSNIFKLDLEALMLMRNNIRFLVVFILTLALIPLAVIVGFVIFFEIFLIPVQSILGLNNPLVFAFYMLLGLYVIAFMGYSVYILGYLLIGEMMQRMLTGKKEKIVSDLVFDYKNALPFVAISSLIWAIAAFLYERKRDSSYFSTIGNTIRNLSFIALLEFLKYYTYISLAAVAFQDKEVQFSISKGEEMFRHEGGKIFSIWTRGGVVLFLIVGVYLLAYMSVISGMYVLLPKEQINELESSLFERYLLPIFAILAITAVIVRLFVEQVSILIYYIRTRHPELNIDKLIGNNE